MLMSPRPHTWGGSDETGEPEAEPETEEYSKIFIGEVSCESAWVASISLFSTIYKPQS